MFQTPSQPRSFLSRLRTTLRAATRRLGFDVCRWPFHVDPLQLHLIELFRQQRIDCVLDVGAHHGEYARYLRHLGYRGLIISFEPLTENLEVLRRVSADDDEWRVLPFALGDRDEQDEIHRTRHNVFSSFLVPNDEALRFSDAGSEVVGSETVPVRRLDGIFEECVAGLDRPRVFLKMDTQGYDLTVLQGASDCLSRIRALQSEVSVKPMYHQMSDFTESLQRYRDLGFEPTGFFPNAQEEDLTVVEFDCVLLARDE